MDLDRNDLNDFRDFLVLLNDNDVVFIIIKKYYNFVSNKIEIKSTLQLKSIMDLNVLPQDVINHIGGFYITTHMKYLCRIDKMKKKVEEIKKRTSDEWIEHIMNSKIYRCKITDVKHTKLQYINMFGDKIYIPKSELINQGSIKHVRTLHLWYVQRIINKSTPHPQYEGETYTNIVGEKMIACVVPYENYDDPHDDRDIVCLVFKKI